jgi:carboxylesterase 2
LSWVSRNIQNFGGNPKKVVIFGSSAGGYSVKQLVANPPSPLPFHAAIIQSEAVPPRSAFQNWREVAKKLKCSSTNQLVCMRAAPAVVLKYFIEAYTIPFGPTDDRVTNEWDVQDNIKNGKAAKVPVVIGTNSEEGSFFTTMALLGNGTLGNFFVPFVGVPAAGDALIKKFAGMYSKEQYSTPLALGTGIFTDFAFQCGANVLAKTFINSGYTVYRYQYVADFPEAYPFDKAGAWHGGEISPLFKTYNPKNRRMDRVSDALQGLWTRLAYNASERLPQWPAQTASDDSVLRFGVTSESVIEAKSIDERCALLESWAISFGI